MGKETDIKTEEIPEILAENAVGAISSDTQIGIDLAGNSPLFGYCRFCGQILSTPEHMLESEANYFATMQCKCTDALNFQTQEKRFKLREQTLNSAAELIDETFPQFTKNTTEDERHTVGQLLNIAAALINDFQLEKVTVKLSGNTTAAISLNKNDVIVIERKDSNSYKGEVC